MGCKRIALFCVARCWISDFCLTKKLQCYFFFLHFCCSKTSCFISWWRHISWWRQQSPEVRESALQVSSMCASSGTPASLLLAMPGCCPGQRRKRSMTAEHSRACYSPALAAAAPDSSVQAPCSGKHQVGMHAFPWPCGHSQEHLCMSPGIAKAS